MSTANDLRRVVREHAELVGALTFRGHHPGRRVHVSPDAVSLLVDNQRKREGFAPRTPAALSSAMDWLDGRTDAVTWSNQPSVEAPMDWDAVCEAMAGSLLDVVLLTGRSGAVVRVMPDDCSLWLPPAKNGAVVDIRSIPVEQALAELTL